MECLFNVSYLRHARSSYFTLNTLALVCISSATQIVNLDPRLKNFRGGYLSFQIQAIIVHAVSLEDIVAS